MGESSLVSARHSGSSRLQSRRWQTYFVPLEAAVHSFEPTAWLKHNRVIVQDMERDCGRGLGKENVSVHDQKDHFAHCIQVFGGLTAASRRLGIDERALRRFINGERPVTRGLMQDIAKALRDLITEAAAAENVIVSE